MFCPRCGHQQASADTRFCSRCRLPLNLAVDLISDTPNQLQREKRELTGVALMLATVLMLLNFLIVFGAVTLPHLANSVFLWIWLLFVVSSLVVGGFGLANLIRGEFFKRLKQREARLFLTNLDPNPQLAEDRTHLSIEATTHRAEPVSITETTTRGLDPIPRRNNGG